MIFSLDIPKQTQEVVFSRKTDKVSHVPLTFNVILVAQISHQKHHGSYLDEKSKVNKGNGIIRKFKSILPKNALLTIYISFIRPNVDYCNFIHDQTHNENSCNNLEEIQYNAALVITGAIEQTSKLEVYEQLNFESIKFRR